jgi:hypothetical protein
VTRLNDEPKPIRVVKSALGVPRWFYLDGKRHKVIQVARRWRRDEEWWRVQHWREYFLVLTHTNLLVEIYHDLISHEWRWQRTYD